MTNERRLRAPNEILRTALENEIQARDFYAQLASECSVDFVKELLQKLQDEESKHVYMIQEMIGRLESGKSLV